MDQIRETQPPPVRSLHSLHWRPCLPSCSVFGSFVIYSKLIFLKMVFLMCSKYSHQSNLVDKNFITNATASLTEMSIAYRVAGAYFRGKRSDKSEITHLYTCSLYLHVCCADSGILACNHRRGHSYPPIPPSCPHSQYKGYSLQSPLIQMIFNIPAPLLPGPGHYQLLLMEAARYQ